MRQIAATTTLPAPRPNMPARPKTKQPDFQLATLFTNQAPRVENPTSWAIQVGSFSRRVNAHKAAIDARRSAERVLGLIPAELSVVMRGEMPLWRVRFGDLEEDQARAACAALFSSGKACIALPLSDEASKSDA